MGLTVGVISDTHDYLDPMVQKIFDGVDYILHAGDIENIDIIRGLEKIAPVSAVAGNHESWDIIDNYPWIRAVEFEKVKIVLTHQFLPLNVPSSFPFKGGWVEEMGLGNSHALVYGHAHEPINHRVGDILYFCPGFAGPPKMEPIRTVGLLKISGAELSGEIYFLSPPPREELNNRARFWHKP